MSNNDVTHLPRLSAENFEECGRLYSHVPVPPLTVNSIIATATEKRTFDSRDWIEYEFTDPTVLDNGEPTEWRLYVYKDGTKAPFMSMLNRLDCIYEWCEGHDTSEANGFDTLYHPSPYKAEFEGSLLSGDAHVGKLHTNPIGVNVYVSTTDRTLSLDELALIGAEWDEFMRAMKPLIRQARDLQLVDELVEEGR